MARVSSSPVVAFGQGFSKISSSCVPKRSCGRPCLICWNWNRASEKSSERAMQHAKTMPFLL
jgi:hypothetical protein